MNNSSKLYQQELRSLYKDIADFTNNNSNLKKDISENPHIVRLIQAFGVIASNLSIMLDESSSEAINMLFDILYPHYNRYIPSIAIVNMEIDAEQDTSFFLPKGKEIEMETEGSESICKYRTCYSTEILPIELSDISCRSDQSEHGTGSVVIIKLSSKNSKPISELKIKTIRFFVQGVGTDAYLIHHNIVDKLDHVILRSKDSTSNQNYDIKLTKDRIKQPGFYHDQSVIPYPENSFLGYRLLTELSIFPQKFLYFDLDIDNVNLSLFGDKFDICIYLKKDDLIDKISRSNLLLNTVPIINLFEVESDPIEIQREVSSYPLIMDRNKPKENEVYEISEVYASIDNQEYPVEKLFAPGLDNNNRNAKFFYSIKNRYNLENHTQNAFQYISILDEYGYVLSSQTEFPKYFYIKALCSNANLPNQLFDSNKSKFKILDFMIPVTSVECITTPTIRSKIAMDSNSKKRLLAHLSPNYLNLINNENGVNYLREIITLYMGNNKLADLLSNNLINLVISPEVSRFYFSGFGQFYKGNRVEIYFDQHQLPGSLLHLFSKILEQFFAIYCSINSFIKIVIKNKEEEIIYEGNPRNGSKCLF